MPERDDRALFEKLVLDGFQAGLSWWIILKKVDNFREAFDGFDPEVIAGWGEAEKASLLADPGMSAVVATALAAVAAGAAQFQLERAAFGLTLPDAASDYL